MRPSPITGVLAVAALTQLAFLGFVLADAAPGWLALSRYAADPEAAEAPHFELYADRVLPELALAIPPHASVLLVTAYPNPIPFEPAFLPRRFRMLQGFDPALLEAAPEKVREQYRERFAQLGRRGQLLGPRSYAEALADSDWVVELFGGLSPAWREGLELVETRRFAKLYRKQPD